MHKFLAVFPAVLLMSCGSQTPESMDAPVSEVDETSVTLPALDPIAQDPVENDSSPTASSPTADDSPFEVIEESDSQEEQPVTNQPPEESADVQSPSEDDSESELAPSDLADEEEPDTDQIEISESGPEESDTEQSVPDDLLIDDVIQAAIPPDLYTQSTCIHEWRNSTGTAIAPNPYNVCTMQITWEMLEGQSYSLVLDGEEIPAQIVSVWEFSIDQLGVESDLNIDLLPDVQVMTCNENHCVTSDILEWVL